MVFNAKRNRTPNWAGIEELESRLLLSATPASNAVALAFPKGAIQLTGDAAGNHVIISGDSGNLVIQGADGTTLTLPAKHPGFTQDSPTQVTGLHALDKGPSLSFAMGGGDDLVEVQNFNGVVLNPKALPTSLKADLGAGNDVLTINGSTLKDLSVAGAKAQSPEVDVTNSTLRGKTTINLGTATDMAVIALSGSQFKGAFALTTSVGDDDVEIDTSSFENTSQVTLGRGDDSLSLDTATLNSLKADLGTGFDSLSISNSTLKDLSVVASKAQSPEVDIFNSVIRGNTTINLGATSDVSMVSISGSDFKGAFALTTAAFDDDVEIDTTTFENKVQIAMGKGDDGLDLEGNVFKGATTIDGGAGSNNLSDDGKSTYQGKKTITKFTVVPI